MIGFYLLCGSFCFNNLDIILFGKVFKCIYIVQLLMVHHKVDHIATFATAKTLVNSFGGRDCKRWCLFVMEGAQAHEICTPLFQVHKIAYHLLDAGGCKNAIYRFARNHKMYLLCKCMYKLLSIKGLSPVRA